MAEAQTQSATPKAKLARHTTRALGRKKRKLKLQNKEFAKTYFEAKSKRSTEKKSAYRKKKKGKK